jgi:hypothetical protein
MDISVDYEKSESDGICGGLKGYVANTRLTKVKIIENNNQS